MYQLTEGGVIDVSAIMLANPYAREVVADPNVSQAQMRMAVRTAILLAQPVRDIRRSRGRPGTAGGPCLG
ncbi:hypothetical protein DA075_22355 [Methylobacterium currus]|uniref:Uncharacterized protein n=1 Tax=Methylobacterium currus TaxID=2051553 RepID=A0A2R4WP27_9HYPH|nr:hypothetical protein DA075_22355 [Methylobacterium currus]